MFLEKHCEEFHVALWRVGGQKFGIRLAVAGSTLRINAITGSWIQEMNQRCRTCRVVQILDQQLLENDQVVSVNGQTELPRMVEELGNLEVECCHLRVQRHPLEARLPNQHLAAAAAAATRPVQNLLRPEPPHLQTIDEPGYHGLPMQTPNGTPVAASLPPLATPERLRHMQSADFSETASVLTLQGTENFAATAQAASSAVLSRIARPPLRMPNGNGLYLEPVPPSLQAVPAGLSAEERQHPQPAFASGASAFGVASAPAPRGPHQAQVIKNYDPFSEPENGYLGVVEGTMVTVQSGSRAAPEARNRFRCDYVFAWKKDEQKSRGWLPVDILDNMPATDM